LHVQHQSTSTNRPCISSTPARATSILAIFFIHLHVQRPSSSTHTRLFSSTYKHLSSSTNILELEDDYGTLCMRNVPSLGKINWRNEVRGFFDEEYSLSLALHVASGGNLPPICE
jgi:hypothetical protein